jgi:NTP pyrophosphatase (non-canonical NTP hydrolase)
MAKLYSRELREVSEELDRALRKHPKWIDAHQGFAVLAEEVHELWDEVRIREGKRRPKRLRKEAIQVAAMALRFALECTR